MFLCLLIAGVLWREPQAPAREDSLFVMFWNVENFFDWKRDSALTSASDEEFSSFGKRRWTKRRFLAKCDNVAKTVLWIADERGSLPDVIGLAEVENRFVLDKLLSETPLRRKDYAIIHYDSPDPRGIDVALLYRKTRLKPLFSKPLKINSGGGVPLLTRDILFAGFQRSSGDRAAFLVNHHPSQLGGKDSPRQAARARLRELTDSLHAAGTARTLAVGDFNQDLWPGAPRGTLKYDGHWEKIDGAFAEGFSAVREEVFDDPLLLVPDSAFGGLKPRRTFVGPRYQGGVSDHLPVVFIVYF